MSVSGKPHGAASLYLAPGVRFLNEAETVLSAMVEGWTNQMLGGRGLRQSSVSRSVACVNDFQAHSDTWPWEWNAGHLDEWMTDLASVRRLAGSTLRSHQYAVRQFCEYLCSPHYGWVEECEIRFGTHPSQIVHEENSRRHFDEFEGRPGRRPLTRDEIQRLFDHIDDDVDERLTTGRKAALLAYRDTTLLKVIYAWGLRANEAVHLDLSDFTRNPQTPEFGDFGKLQVRFGKASKGGPPKRRTVITLHQWAVDALQDYLANARPLAIKTHSDALFLTERGTRMKARDVSERFALYRDEIDLDTNLTPHALRHSYVTHLTEDGVDPEFVKQQVGHAYLSTTAIYTGVSTDFKNQLMKTALAAIMPKQERTTDEQGH